MTNYPKPEPDSGLGVHTSPNGDFPLGRSDNLIRDTINNLKKMGITWAKVVLTQPYDTDWQQRAINALQQAGIMVIVRLFVHKPYPGNTTPEFYQQVRTAVIFWRARGVHYFELRNEPNLRDAEWESDSHWHGYGSLQGRAQRAAQLFLQDAQVILAAGGIPLTPALAPGGHDDDERVWHEMCAYWRKVVAHDLLRQCAIAEHNYTLNHPINYPYDTINQKEYPGIGLWHGGQSNGFLKYRYRAKVFRDYMGFTIPVLSTEDGPLLWNHDDDRYPRVDEAVHRDMTLQIAEFMAWEAEEDYLCTAFWLYGSKIFEAHGDPPPWEKDAWVSTYGSKLPNRSGVELPVMDALRQRGYVGRRKGVKWAWDGAMQPAPTPNWLIDVVDKLPVHATLRYPKRTKPVDTVVIHHTATDTGTTIEAIARYHTQADGTRNKDEWAGIGYSIVIATDGTTYLTQRLDTQGNHVFAHNDHTIGVSFIGNFTENPPSPAQMASGKRALAWLLQQLNLKPENVVGHKDLPLQSTACPGNLPVERWWRSLLDTPPVQPLDKEAIRNFAYTTSGIPYAPHHAFIKRAQQLNLGAPLGVEHDLRMDDGNSVRMQKFAGGILVARLTVKDGIIVAGDWDNLELITW